MLTRDISLDDCILDLVDNSIDSAWQHAGARPTAFGPGRLLAGYRIEIEFSANHFKISDNCGGMSLDNAAEYAFTFGRKDRAPDATLDVATNDDPAHNDFSVGVYGIGMKRAIFKLGNLISITSTHTGTERESFRVPIDVVSWLKDARTPWDFDIEMSDPLDDPGVIIEVNDLSEEARRRFTDPTYQQQLISDVLRRDYLVPLMQGLSLKVNDREVNYRPMQLLASQEFSPMREAFMDGDVSVEIIAGMHAAPPDDNEPESTRQDRDSGWYIVCNGRVVLSADRTEVTGWGAKDFPRWHGQYAGFLGMVLFGAADASALPMTTTKRSVDAASGIYQRTLNRMLVPARAWVDYTNARKNALEQARVFESSAKPVEASTVAPSSTVQLPKIVTTRAKVANINYSVPLERMKLLAAALGDINMSYRDVGIESFEYTYAANVDEPS